MMRSRFLTPVESGGSNRPPFGTSAKPMIARSMSGACDSIGDQLDRERLSSGLGRPLEVVVIGRPRIGDKCDASLGAVGTAEKCRVEMCRGGGRLNISVAASFVWRCLSGSAMASFPHPAHRTGRADFPHPALGQDFTPSPTARRAQAGTGVRAGSARKGARVDKLRPCVA